MSLLLLKLRALELNWKLVYILERTVQETVLDSYFQHIASDSLTIEKTVTKLSKMCLLCKNLNKAFEKHLSMS